MTVSKKRERKTFLSMKTEKRKESRNRGKEKSHEFKDHRVKEKI